jgi:hypothetical protein
MHRTRRRGACDELLISKIKGAFDGFGLIWDFEMWVAVAVGGEMNSDLVSGVSGQFSRKLSDAAKLSQRFNDSRARGG